MGAAPPGLRLRIGHETMEATAPGLGDAIARANAAASIEGLPDRLNPAIIDPAKVHAMLQGLPPAASAVLDGKALLLSPALLRIGTSSPTKAGDFAGGWTLERRGTHGDAVSARATVPTECSLAQSRAAEARGAFAQAEAAVESRRTAQPADNAGLVALSAARSRRFAIATVWKDNATAALACAPADPALRDDLAAATAAAAAAIVAPQARGMP